MLTVVIGGSFIFPVTPIPLRLSGRRAFVSRKNPFISLGMQVALVLPFSMLLLVAGLALFVFAWIGRSTPTGEASAPSTHQFA